MPTNKKGSARERECVNLLHDSGFAVLRAPASGGGSTRALPDVLCGNGEVFYAMELKASGGDPIYLTDEEVGALEFFAANFGAKALVGVRFDIEHGDPPWGVDDDDGWRFHEPASLHRTPGGNYRVKKETALGDGARIEDLVGGAA